MTDAVWSMALPRIEIRRAVRADAAAIVATLRASIIRLCLADHGGCEEPMQLWLANKTVPSVERWINDASNVLLIAEIGGEMAGVACLRRDGWITLNYVSPSHRFAGVSKALLAALVTQARGIGPRGLNLESTATALAFYRSAGFVEAEPTKTKHGLTIFPMTMALEQT